MGERLSREKELDLISRTRAGEQQAREELILAHMGLVHLIAAKLCKAWNRWDWHEDLISVGYIELIRTVDDENEKKRFDPKRGFRFSTYAYVRIHDAMVAFIRKETRKQSYESESLDKSLNETGKAKAWADNSLNPVEQFVQGEQDEIHRCLVEALSGAIGRLREAYQTEIKLFHFELFDFEGDKVKKIAARLCKSEGTVKSDLSRARKELREYLSPLLAAAPSHSRKEVKHNA